MKVTAIGRASISDDGSAIELEVKGPNDASVILTFTAESLEAFTGQTTQMVALAHERQAQASGQTGIRAADVNAVAALAPAASGKVLLRLRAPSGMIYSFALNPALAENLRPELHKAAYAARQQLSAMKAPAAGNA